MKVNKYLLIVFALFSVSFIASSQEKTLAYYNSHPKEILGDAQISFFNSDYEHTIELCNWHFIIVGDTKADALKERAQQCMVLYQELQALTDKGDNDTLREKALALLQLNLYDEEAARCLKYELAKGVSNNHAWIDLGLSVKWSVCNLGAFLPEENGDYYRWGESVPYHGYNESKYRFDAGRDSSDNMRFSKYNTINNRGRVDNKTMLEYSDDAARVNWGGNWRMPTKEECEELISNCSMNQVLLNGQKGYFIVSSLNNNCLFIPKADNVSDSFIYKDGTVAYYWTSSLNEKDPSQAYVLEGFWVREKMELSCYFRNEGLSIRPVIE